jgi:CRISPR/Cas system-associated exonuclease Cas4 (RecB family)
MDEKDRQQYIGASDLTDLFETDGWGCKRKLYYKKIGQEPDYVEDNFHLRRGNLLEPIAATLYSEETGRKLRRVNQRLVDKEYPFMTCLLDREIVGDPKGIGVLEIKCPSMRTFNEVKRSGAQEGYILQLQAQMRMRKAQWGSYGFFSAELAELFSFDLLRDDELIQKIIEGELAFWQLVKNQTPPDKLPGEGKDKRCKRCSYSLSCQDLRPEDADNDPFGELPTMITDPELEKTVEEYWEAKAIYDEAEEYYESIKERIKGGMQTHDLQRAIVGTSKVYFPLLDGKAKWNTKAMEKDAELVKKYRSKGKPYRRLSLYRMK